MTFHQFSSIPSSGRDEDEREELAERTRKAEKEARKKGKRKTGLAAFIDG